jgi:mannose-6-phosphate isomerase
MATEQVRKNRSVMRAPPLSRGMRFAELWMGTHPNGHSSVILPHHRGDQKPSLARTPSWNTSVNLQQMLQIQEEDTMSSDDEGAQEWYLRDIIQDDPGFWLGETDSERKDLPFLFKVLSIRQALSIQAHPNKKLAEELHRSCPGHYPDDNHKPEICIPLGHFEALCGFRRISEVRQNVREVPELRELISIAEDEIEAAPLCDLFSRMMKSNPVKQSLQVVALISRLKESLDPSRDEKLILRLSLDYPTDVGVFAVYFLNYVVITKDMPNRFIFCAPDEPHAYLCGDAIECMAQSDNVIRAGLTPKFKDVDSLLRCMTWRDDLLDELVSEGEHVHENIIKYDPPVEDFLVYEISGAVPEGIFLEKAAIAACVTGSFRVDFHSARHGCKASEEESDVPGATVESTVPWSWRGAKKIVKGNTFFSRAGTRLVVQAAEEGAKLFIATY